MPFISLKNSKNFSKISGDKNKIHFDENVANSYFFRKPIAHGINLTIIALKKILYSKNNRTLDKLKINYKNYCLNNEKFKLTKKKNIYLIKNEINTKIEIELKLKKGLLNNQKYIKNNKIKKKISKFYSLKKKYYYLDLFSHFFYLTKKIGNFNSQTNSLIYSIETRKKNFSSQKKNFKIKKITKNIFCATIVCEGYESKVIFSKLVKLYYNTKKFNLDKKIKKIIRSKKFLIFGSSGDVGKAISLFLKKEDVEIIKISLMKKMSMLKLSKIIKKFKPAYLFYLSSPRIVNDKDNTINSFKLYNNIYSTKFKNILDILLKNKLTTKVFYPSTFALGQRDKFLKIKSYLDAKNKAEKLCKKHKYSKYIYCYRLPAYKSRTNYNILGYYEGEELSNLKKYLNRFFIFNNKN